MRLIRRLNFPEIVFWLLAGLTAMLVAALLLVLGGVIPIESAQTTSDGLERPARTAPSESASTTERATTSSAITPSSSQVTVVVLTAVRGESWFSARVGSENGRVLDERVLTQGQSVSLRARRIWLSIGAAGNIELTVDGKPSELSTGTVSIVLPLENATSELRSD